MSARAISIAPLLIGAALLAGCAEPADRAGAGGTPAATTVRPAEQRYPDVIAAEAEPEEDGTWTISATISSHYDTPERYADAWRVLGPDGAEYGIRVLTHDHANEQPFTRSQRGIEIPAEVDVVTIEGRDLANGWGGGTFELRLPDR